MAALDPQFLAHHAGRAAAFVADTGHQLAVPRGASSCGKSARTAQRLPTQEEVLR